MTCTSHTCARAGDGPERTSIALFLGPAFAALLEAARARRPGPITADPGA
ncbi:hypothetical protein ACFWEB_25555 [Streptomyces parvus]|nr:hypothetical protein [Streptomyces sp. st77]